MARVALVLAIALSPGCRGSTAQDDVQALASGERVERIPTRAGVEVPVLVVAPEHTRAVVLLFPGGDGDLGLGNRGIARGGDNFVVRIRARLAAAGIVAVVVDVPSDHTGGITDFRISAAHADDVAKIVAWAKAKWPVPVWLVGTSRGTISAANAVSRGVAVDGLVLTSAVTAGDKEKLGDLALDKISTRLAFIHHVHDACSASPLRGAEHLASKLHAGWQTFDGGAQPTGGACSPESHHGFLGLDAEVAAAIVQTVTANSSGG